MPDINQELQTHHAAVSSRGSEGNQAAGDANPSAAKGALEEVSDTNSYISAVLTLPDIKSYSTFLKKPTKQANKKTKTKPVTPSIIKSKFPHLTNTEPQ